MGEAGWQAQGSSGGRPGLSRRRRFASLVQGGSEQRHRHGVGEVGRGRAILDVAVPAGEFQVSPGENAVDLPHVSID